MRKRGYQPSRKMRVYMVVTRVTGRTGFWDTTQQAYRAMLFRKMADVNSAHASSPVE